MINTAVIVLRYTQPDLERPFRLVSIGRFPITPALGIVTSLAIGLQFAWSVYVVFAIVAGVGGASYVVLKRRSRRANMP